MIRAVVVLTLLAIVPGTASSQAPGVLRVRVTLTDAARGAMPIPRHALLISDNPSTTGPRRIVTAADGSAEVRLRPGNYTVESDEPVAFGGQGYQWVQTVDITAGGELVLELTAANAEIGASPAASSSENVSSLLLPQWQDTVVAVWTPEARASGFLVDAAGLVVTSQRVIGSASAVEVQLTPAVKVAARVLVADRVRDIAVLWIDPATTASVRPLPLACGNGSSFAARQKFVTIGAPLSGPKEISSGDVFKAEAHAILADFRLAPGSIGGPVFNPGGSVVGLTSIVDEQDERSRRDARIVPVDDVCEAVKSAAKAMQTAKRPVATLLPVEPRQPFPPAALDAAVKRHAGSLNPYQMSSSDFEIAFLSPALVSLQQHSPPRSTAPKDFGVWSDYFAEVPAVLVVRVTPKLAESFWTTIARGAAYTQGMMLPPIKHFKPGFSRLRAYCGEVEVTPIHPFTLERRVSETDAIREGLYVFDPEALGPHCKTVKLVVYSEKQPQKPDTRPVDPKLIEQIWQDFAI